MLMVLSVLVTGCAKKSDASVTVEQSQNNTVGFLLRNTTEPFLKEYAESMVAAAAKEKVDLRILDANGDEKTQLEQLDVLITQGVRSFVIIAQSSKLTETIAKKIAVCGGYASFSNTPPTIQALKESKRLYYASSPEISCGRIQAAILDDYFKKNPKQLTSDKMVSVLMLEGSASHPAQKYRFIGFNSGLIQAGYTVTYLDTKDAGWSAVLAQPIMDRWLSEYRNSFDVVIAQNDDMAMGAIASLMAKKYTDTPAGDEDTDGDGLYIRVPVIGADGTDEAVESMNNHLLYATVLQDSKLQSLTALELVLACQKNGTAVEYTTSTGISAPTAVMAEEPMTDRDVLDQCFLIPFKPVYSSSDIKQ